MNRLLLTAALATLSLPVIAQQDPWWKHAVFYEVYPRSYQDSNGDGLGDLNGITRRLPYLQKLGVDAVWIAPMYPSPQVDFGYDISDYEAVEKLIAMRRTNPALRDGTLTMLDASNPNVLSYPRTAPNGQSVLISLNMTSQPQTVTLLPGVSNQPVKTLVTSTPTLQATATLTNLTLPPYASWIATLQ